MDPRFKLFYCVCDLGPISRWAVYRLHCVFEIAHMPNLVGTNLIYSARTVGHGLLHLNLSLDLGEIDIFGSYLLGTLMVYVVLKC